MVPLETGIHLLPRQGLGFLLCAVAFGALGRPQAPPASPQGVGELEMVLTRAAKLPLESHEVCPKGAQKPVCRPGKMIINTDNGFLYF